MIQVPEVDLSKIAFPSDDLTIKALRRHFPAQLDTGKHVTIFSENANNNAAEWIGNMLIMERDLAKATFGSLFGREPTIVYVDDDVSLLTEDLASLYVRFGIADGPSTAKELIRGIESQATAQARQQLPPR